LFQEKEFENDLCYNHEVYMQTCRHIHAEAKNKTKSVIEYVNELKEEIGEAVVNLLEVQKNDEKKGFKSKLHSGHQLYLKELDVDDSTIIRDFMEYLSKEQPYRIINLLAQTAMQALRRLGDRPAVFGPDPMPRVDIKDYGHRDRVFSRKGRDPEEENWLDQINREVELSDNEQDLEYIREVVREKYFPMLYDAIAKQKKIEDLNKRKICTRSQNLPKIPHVGAVYVEKYSEWLKRWFPRLSSRDYDSVKAAREHLEIRAGLKLERKPKSESS